MCLNWRFAIAFSLVSATVRPIETAARLLVGYLFTARGKHRITASCDARNAASAVVLEKLGMPKYGSPAVPVAMLCWLLLNRFIDAAN